VLDSSGLGRATPFEGYDLACYISGFVDVIGFPLFRLRSRQADLPRLAATPTFAPSAANPSATALPISRPPPVTIAVFPSSRIAVLTPDSVVHLRGDPGHTGSGLLRILSHSSQPRLPPSNQC